MKNKQNLSINKSSDIQIGNINFNVNSDPSNKIENSSPGNIEQKKKLKEKIASNEIAEVVRNLLDEGKLTERESNYLYSINYRINILKEKIGKGIFTYEESNIERNKIATSLIEFVDQLDFN